MAEAPPRREGAEGTGVAFADETNPVLTDPSKRHDGHAHSALLDCYAARIRRLRTRILTSFDPIWVEFQ